MYNVRNENVVPIFMKILDLLYQKKDVAGIEISDSMIRVAFFRPQKNIKKEKTAKNTSLVVPQELVFIEQPIDPGIIADGKVVDAALLGKALNELRIATKLKSHYAVVAIPDDTIYSHVFSFPKSVGDTQLSEAMRLAIGFQLPEKIENVYLDWERAHGSKTMNEVLLSMVPRTAADEYLRALEISGWKIIALESHLAAIARAVKLEVEQMTLFVKKNPDSTSLFAIKNGVLRFSRTLPISMVPEEKVEREIKKVKTSLEASEGAFLEEQPLLDARICEAYALHPALTAPKAKWLIALGAAIRGQIPEGQDSLISLLPVGTEEAYAYQKATTFIILVRDMTVAVSIFFIATYLLVYLFAFSIFQKSNFAIVTLSVKPLPAEFLAKESRVKQVNILAATAKTILSETPMWSTVLEELSARTIEGVNISNFNAGALTEKMNITGTARDRTTLNKLKTTLQESPMFGEIDIPITNIEQRSDIPFSASFRLKDPNAVYYK